MVLSYNPLRNASLHLQVSGCGAAITHREDNGGRRQLFPDFNMVYEAHIEVGVCCTMYQPVCTAPVIEA